jgi:hypothetical protein
VPRLRDAQLIDENLPVALSRLSHDHVNRHKPAIGSNEISLVCVTGNNVKVLSIESWILWAEPKHLKLQGLKVDLDLVQGRRSGIAILRYPWLRCNNLESFTFSLQHPVDGYLVSEECIAEV